MCYTLPINSQRRNVMEQLKCAKCGSPISEEQLLCPSCGFQNDLELSKRLMEQEQATKKAKEEQEIAEKTLKEKEKVDKQKEDVVLKIKKFDTIGILCSLLCACLFLFVIIGCAGEIADLSSKARNLFPHPLEEAFRDAYIQVGFAKVWENVMEKEGR